MYDDTHATLASGHDWMLNGMYSEARLLEVCGQAMSIVLPRHDRNDVRQKTGVVPIFSISY